MSLFTESGIESITLSWFRALGYQVLHGPSLAPGLPAAERLAGEAL